MDRSISRLFLSFLFVYFGFFSVSWAVEDGSALSVKYCGLGFLGKDSDKQSNYPFLARTALNDIGTLSGRLLGLTRDSNSHLRIADANSESSNYALSYILASEKFESQKFINPISKKQQFNNIFKVALNAVVFDMQKAQIVGIFPWIYQFNEASDVPLTAEEKAARFAGFFNDMPIAPSKKTDSEDSDDINAGNMLMEWSKSLQNLNFNDKQKTLGVSPVKFSDASKGTLGSDSMQTIDKLSRELTSQYEIILSSSFQLPVIPSGNAGETGDQFVASIPSCLGQGEYHLTMPSPTYRFGFDVEQLQTAQIVQDIAGQDNKRYEVGFGARIRTTLQQTDDSDTVNGGKLILDNKIKSVTSKSFVGNREFGAVDQYQNLLIATMGQLVPGFLKPDESWLKSHLSKEESAKPSAVKKTWVDVFKNKVGLPSSK